MNRRVRQVFCAIKEHSSISYAKMATVGGYCDINLIIVKATAPDDFPLQEKYIQELLKIFSISSSYFHSFSISFTRRFAKTHCWKVALKCLLLLHRLLRSLPESSPFRTELLWARSNGLLCLHPCHFRDDSSSTPGDYTNLIRSYAHLLDEVLSCFTLEGKEVDEEEGDENFEDETTPMSLKDIIREVTRLLEVLPQLQSIIDRIMNCMPTGPAARSFIVQSAMKHIIRDSFICYSTFRKDIVLVLDNLFQMPYRNSILAFGIYKKAALQADQLCQFYDWCKAKGLCGAYEYPFIDRIPQIQIRALETFLGGMWQLTEGSSSTNTSPSSWVEDFSKSSSTEDDHHDHTDKQLVVARQVEVNTQRERMEDEENDLPLEVKGSHEEMAPLIQLEDGENDVNWEDLLEASVDQLRIPWSNYLIYPPNYRDWKLNGHGWEGNVQKEEENNQLQLQVYNPYAFNPFCQPYYIVYCGNPESFNPFRQPHYLVGSIPNNLVACNPWSFRR